jgi:hypothetical protein
MGDTHILKGIALLLLLCHHLFYASGDFDDLYIGQIPVIQTFGMQSKLCVAIFVFLSGYGLMSGAIKTGGIPNVLAFYRKRYVKLMVNFWLIWLLFVPVGVLLFNRTFPDVYGEHYILRVFTDLLGICSTSSYNPTWWFYGCIICLYVLFPFLYRIIDYWYLLIPLSAVLAFDCSIPMPGFDLVRGYLCAFLLGMIIRKCPPQLAKAPTGLLLFSTIVLFVCRMWTSSLNIVWDVVIVGVGVSAYVQMHFPQFIARTLGFLGKHSFNIFLFHTFIFYYFFHDYVYWSRNPLCIYLTLLAVCIPISMFIEWSKQYFHINQLQNKLMGTF